MATTSRTLLLAALALLGSALVTQKEEGAPRRHLRLRRPSLGMLPMHFYKEDCGKVRPVSALLQHNGTQQVAKNPGAGMDPSVKPFRKVLKDGFYQVDCVKDYMFEHGDKFGDNRFSYKLGSISNVSILHYEMLVEREDREPMSVTTCFSLCRTVPEMIFFGLRNGNDCYCAPYYKPMAGDSSDCDVTCPGDPTTMCGGLIKSSIYAMHACSDTADDLASTFEKMESVAGDLKEFTEDVKKAAETMQDTADVLQPLFGAAGDPAAADLMRTAGRFAGELEKAVKVGEKLSTELEDLKSQESDLAGADFEDFEKAKEAEDLIAKMEEGAAEGEAAAEELSALLQQASPSPPEGALKQYYSVVYFVDKKYEHAPSTCGGKLAGKPLVGSAEDCAAACDSKLKGCVGFSYFKNEDDGLCFLLSKFTSTTYYIGCDEGSSLLQAVSGKALNATQCKAKLSEFQGTTLKPDGSGKCKQCMKEATKANRCFKK